MQNEKFHFCELLFCPYSKANTHTGQSLFGQVMHTVLFSYRINFWDSMEYLWLLEKWCKRSYVVFLWAAFSSTLSEPSPAQTSISALSDWSRGIAWRTGSTVLSCVLHDSGDMTGERLQSRESLRNETFQHLFQAQLSSQAFFSAVNKER